jgi:hypothetical protein
MLVPPPIKYLNLSDGILQVAMAYLQAELDGAPDANRKLFLNWLEMANTLLQQQQQRQQQLHQAAQQQNAAKAGLAPQQMAAAAQGAAQ